MVLLVQITLKKKWLAAVSDLNTASQQGLAERFDSTVGANTVLMPFGGKFKKHLPKVWWQNYQFFTVKQQLLVS